MVQPPEPPAAVATAFAAHPEPVRERLLAVRALIFDTAAKTDGVGQLTETLKWGEPAYLTEKTRSGTTIRLGVSKDAPGDCAMFVNCQTTLVDDFRAHFADALAFEGTRGVIVPVADPMPTDALAFVIGAALTYHANKTRSRPPRA